MRRFKKLMAVLCAAVCAFSLMATPVYADTDGTEIQVAESSQLEIQLGTAWSGAEFQLRTDVGMYPDTIIVGEDGVLRLEIGGSSTYTLTCLNSAVTAPQVGEVDIGFVESTDTPEAEEPAQTDSAEEAVPDESAPQDPAGQDETEAEPDAAPTPDEEHQDETTQEEGTLAGIPIMHIVLFGGGLLLAAGGLIAIRIVSKRREDRDDYYDDYDDDDE